MQIKLIEVRDRGTFVPVLCVNANPAECQYFAGDVQLYEARRYLLRRCGYACDARPIIIYTKLAAGGDPCSCDPHYWEDRTHQIAHSYVTDHWDELHDGDVVDVEFILGETKAAKVSERASCPL